MGDILRYEDKPAIHAHAVIGRRDGETRGGHLLEATIHPTCEQFLDESPYGVHKEIDPEFGPPRSCALIQPGCLLVTLAASRIGGERLAQP
jgi:predicted DNA-binding protein with PD1-like motif